MQGNREYGFGIIELVVTLAVVGILATIAAPSLMTMIRDNRMTAYTNQLTATLMRARSEAISRRGSVTVCPSSNGTACNTTQAELGWISFWDVDADGVADGGAEVILETSAALPAGSTLRTAAAGDNFGGGNFIRFNSRGLPNAAGTLKLCDARGAASARAVAVNLVGNIIRPLGQTLTGVALTCP